MLLFICLFACLLNFSRVAFVFSLLTLIKAWQNKRAGGLENGLFDTFMDSICVWLENSLFDTFWTLAPVGLKLPNRVRWPGGGIPYSFQNIPLCPGVFEEKFWKTVEKSVEETVEETVEKSMMYSINNVDNSM